MWGVNGVEGEKGALRLPDSGGKGKKVEEQKRNEDIMRVNLIRNHGKECERETNRGREREQGRKKESGKER